MDKQQLKNIIDGMPDGMEVDDYLLEVVNRALFLERREIVVAIEDHIDHWDHDYKEAVREALEVISERGRK